MGSCWYEDGSTTNTGTKCGVYRHNIKSCDSALCGTLQYSTQMYMSLKQALYKISLHSRPSQPAAREEHAARGDIQNEKNSFDSFPGKAEIKCRSNSEDILAVYIWRHALHCQFILHTHAISSNTLAYTIHYILIIFPIMSTILLLQIMHRK
jgi:hypothetical protein